MNESEKDNQEQLQPQLRFKGFTQPWEQRQLGKLAAITMGQSPSSKNYTANPADHILVQGNADIENGWVSPRRWTTEVTKTASPGDLIMSVRAPVGAMAKTAYDVVLGRGVAGIKGDEFLYQLLCSLDSSGYWSRVSSGSTFDAISGQELSHTPVTIPSSADERKCIGQFFKTLDSTIYAAKRQRDLLQLKRQAYLQQIFPRDSEQKPQLRFSGFTDDWELHQLGELIDLYDGRDYKSLNAGPIPVYGTGGYITSVDDALSWGQDAVGIGRKGTIDQPFILHAPFWTVDTLFYAIPLQKDQLPFIYSLIQSIPWRKKNQASGLPSLSRKIILSTKVLIPKVDEQYKIGNLFTTLDSLIASSANKLDALHRLKQGYMQKMFI